MWWEAGQAGGRDDGPAQGRHAQGRPARAAGRAKGVISVRLDRPVRGALVRVQPRVGVRYRTVAQGRVSGRRFPVAPAFATPGRYLMRIQIREAGAKLVSR